MPSSSITEKFVFGGWDKCTLSGLWLFLRRKIYGIKTPLSLKYEYQEGYLYLSSCERTSISALSKIYLRNWGWTRSSLKICSVLLYQRWFCYQLSVYLIICQQQNLSFHCFFSCSCFRKFQCVITIYNINCNCYHFFVIIYTVYWTVFHRLTHVLYLIYCAVFFCLFSAIE